MHSHTHRVLVVEDEESLREGLCDALVYHGYESLPAASGEAALELQGLEPCDLVLLDVMLPGLSGFEVCARLRATHPALAILMLTARGSEEDIVSGFRSGADDYVTKPFSVRELMLRVEALLRRAHHQPARQQFEIGPWQIDLGSLQARSNDEVIDLTPREAHVLSVLCREGGRVTSRRTLLKEVWQLNNVDAIETRTVDVHMAKLRKKIDRSKRSLIETVRGVGYRLVAAKNEPTSLPSSKPREGP